MHRKWHLGMQWTRLDGTQPPLGANLQPDAAIDLSGPITAGPLTAGFDYYFGVDIAAQPPFGFINNDRFTKPIPDRPKPPSMYGRPGRMQAGWRFDKLLPTIADKSVAFLRKHAARAPKKPFFLYVAFTAPHVPIAPSSAFIGKTKATAYGDFVAEVDASVGAILNTLDELQERNKTLVLFTSDNGSPERNGEGMGGPIGSVPRDCGHEPNRPWRGLKGDIHEGGHRVPFIARWPGRIRAGHASNALICHIDVFATVAAMVRHEVPENAGEDSVSILPVLLGQVKLPVRNDVVLHSWDGMFAVRQGDWKLIEGLGSGGFSRPRRVQPKPDGPRGQLYNLANDPAETNNLYRTQPDVVTRLSALLKRRRSEGQGQHN